MKCKDSLEDEADETNKRRCRRYGFRILQFLFLWSQQFDYLIKLPIPPRARHCHLCEITDSITAALLWLASFSMCSALGPGTVAHHTNDVDTFMNLMF